ncbi:MAG TPA: heparinase II/III family protein [Ignavibacteriales bacterium]|nr:heparinase II/III family protein [Ignavibacteriales bacterium]
MYRHENAPANNQGLSCRNQLSDKYRHSGKYNIQHSESLSRFGVARRYNPEIKIVKHSLSEDHKMDFLFEGQFDGYSKLIGDNISHTRRVEIIQSKREISVRDYIDGKGLHSVKSYIHLVPGTLLEKAGNKYYAETDSVKFTVEILSGAPEIQEGFYSPCFNIKLKNPVITIIEEKQLPSLIHYKIRF